MWMFVVAPNVMNHFVGCVGSISWPNTGFVPIDMAKFSHEGGDETDVEMLEEEWEWCWHSSVRAPFW